MPEVDERVMTFVEEVLKKDKKACEVLREDGAALRSAIEQGWPGLQFEMDVEAAHFSIQWIHRTATNTRTCVDHQPTAVARCQPCIEATEISGGDGVPGDAIVAL